jgi:hypothetical protein
MGRIRLEFSRGALNVTPPAPTYGPRRRLGPPRQEGEDVGDVTVQSDGTDIFVVVDDLRIARRARPGTPQAGTWISLEPGWRVTGGPDEIMIERDDDVRVH